jgi:large repetitive protein
MRRFLTLFFRSALFLSLVVTSMQGVAQNYTGHNWYFGNSNQAIRFNRTDNSASLVTNKAIPFGVGGSSVATDPTNGNLLFYTDGANIYDVTNTIMPAGSGLGANTSANQPVAIAKAPGQKTQYYVFMNTANGTTGGSVSFRMVDLAAFGNAVFPNPAQGNAIGGNTAVAGLTGRSEAMITVPHANREDFWLITHANGTPDYSVTLFTATGPGATMNINGVGLIDVAANFSYHANSGRISVSPQEDRRDIEIVDFDNTNGVITFNQRVLNTGIPSTAAQTIYDTEWSNNGQYLYVSYHGETGIQADVKQYDLLDNFSTLTSVLPQPNTIFRSFGLQMAPDSAIYHLYQTVNATGPFLLGKLTNTDTVATEVIYDPTAFNSNTFNGMQFSSFAPRDSVLLSVDFTFRGTCSGAPTSFFPTVTPGADSLVWDFGDGSGGAGWSPVYTYENGGSYNVRLTAFLKGDTASVTHPVTITQFDLQLDLVQDTTACACELPINNGKPMVNGTLCPNDTSDDMAVTATAQGGSGTPTFQWFGPGGMLTGQNTATLRPDSAGYYYVVATLGGCSAYAGVNIKEYDSLNQQANIWYFGQHAGIDFNGLPDDPVVAITGPLDTPEGCSVICDRNGQVIFSTDGLNIYDKDDNDITPLPNPPGLGGEPGSTQSALIMPVPGDETLYYIFTTQQVHGSYTYELRYSLFDLKLNNGQGGLAEYNKLLFSKSTERITGNANWLIAHEYGNNSFRAYNISPQGISNPIISSIGSDHSFAVAENGQGYMELGTPSRLAVALSTPGVRNVVEIFDFIDSTGMVTNFRTANLNSASGQVYGIEISPAGNKLFATLKNPGGSTLYEFAFDTLAMPYNVQRVNQTGELGAMQRGPDGQIYVAVNGSANLGTFTANEDTTGISAITTLQPFALVGGTNSELGLPNFIQIISNPTSQPGFSFTGLCFGDSTRFSAVGKDPAIDKFDWTFGDGESMIDGGPEVAHLYSAPGTYPVSVRIYNKCEEVGIFPGTVTIRDVPPNPSTAVNMCTGDALLDANPANLPNLSYSWDTGDTTETILVTRQGFYDVTVTDDLGCSTDGQIIAADNRPQFEFGPNPSICQNTAIFPLDAQNPGATYVWSVDDVTNGNTAQTQSVDTSLPGVFEYKVVVTDPITSCFRRDSIVYTINESPAFNAVPANPSSCGILDGRIDLTITAPATALFTYFITGPNTTLQNTDQAANVLITAPGLGAGVYGITVSDQVSGCATISTVTINDPAFTVAGTQNGTCDPISINVTVTPTPGPLVAPFSYRVINSATTTEVQAPTSFPGPGLTWTTNAVPSNNQQYIVEVTNAGCIASSPPVTINQSAAVQTTLSANPCTDPISVTATVTSGPGTPAFTWTGNNIVSGANLATVVADPPEGDQTYNVTITQGTLCPLDTAITVNVNNSVIADFDQSDACEDQVVLTASPAGPYTYRWYRDNVAIPGGGGQQIIAGLNDNNHLYRVEVVNAQTGCVFSTPDTIVNVAGDIRVTILATIPCEGSPFTLTAVPNPASINTFVWTLDNVVIPGQSGSVLSETRGGEYVVAVNQSGCRVTDYMNVIVLPVTPGSLQDTGEICPGPDGEAEDPLVLNAGPNFLTYQWFDENGAPDGNSQTYEVTVPGTYRVELLNAYGCPSSDQIIIEEECDPLLVGPNAFRPTSNVQANGEFSNRDFRLFTFYIDDTDFEVFIFNRWGEMVYQSNERDFRWNGGYNNNAGQPLPPGTYSYLVKFKSSYRPEDGILERRGGVVLLR